MPEIKRFVLRIPTEEHRRYVAWARAEGRSLHGHLLWLIREAYRERREQRAPADARDGRGE